MSSQLLALLTVEAYIALMGAVVGVLSVRRDRREAS